MEAVVYDSMACNSRQGGYSILYARQPSEWMMVPGAVWV